MTTNTRATLSYASQRLGAGQRLNELLWLVKSHRGTAEKSVAKLFDDVDLMRRHVAEHTGADLRSIDILDVGCGQTLGFSTVLAQESNVVGIDMEVVPVTVRDYVELWRRNGPLRTTKTVARKALGFDREFRREIAKRLGRDTLRRPKTLPMDASDLRFGDASFDFVYSYSTFEHVEDPQKVLSEIVRVLKPNGTAYLHLHLFTHDSGAHDARILKDRRTRSGLPAWAHLRPQHEGLIKPSAYLNRLGLQEWRQIFSTALPGCSFEQLEDGRAYLEPELAELRANGELTAYTDEDLFTAAFIAIWKKPAELQALRPDATVVDLREPATAGAT